MNEQDLWACVTFFFLKSSKTMEKSNLTESSKPQIYNVSEYKHKMKRRLITLNLIPNCFQFSTIFHDFLDFSDYKMKFY